MQRRAVWMIKVCYTHSERVVKIGRQKTHIHIKKREKTAVQWLRDETDGEFCLIFAFFQVVQSQAGSILLKTWLSFPNYGGNKITLNTQWDGECQVIHTLNNKRIVLVINYLYLIYIFLKPIHRFTLMKSNLLLSSQNIY